MITKYLQKLKHYEPILVDPKDLVNQHSLNKVSFDLSGDWDTIGESITSGYIYKSFKKRLEGADWKSTRLYQRKYKKGNRWLRKLPIWDQMLQDIVSNGYTQQPNKNRIDEYISILIGRHGHMFIYNGIHRLVCCLLSDKVSKIPVKILLRHSEWDTFKSQCLSYAKHRGSLYCQLPHPDLESIPYYWTNERANLIAKHSFYPGGSILDAGSHWGTTSYVLSTKGFKVEAVERSKPHYNKLKKLSQWPGPGFKATNSNVLDNKGSYNTLVLLNLVHHFLKDRRTLSQFIDFLNDLKFDEIFYQSHKPDDKWAPYMTPSETLKTIIEATEMYSVTSLENFNGRQLYHITR